MHTRRPLFLLAIVCLVCAGPAMAYEPPPADPAPDWWGKSDSTVLGCWDLEWDDNDDVKNVSLVDGHNLGYQWQYTSADRTLSFEVQNRYDSSLWKDVYVWWQYEGPSMQQDDLPGITASVPAGAPPPEIEKVAGDMSSYSGFMRWHIWPQPESETITWTLPAEVTLSGDGADICIGTNCTPEPCTALLLALTAPAAAFLTRRLKSL